MSAPRLEDGSFDRCNIYDADFGQGGLQSRPDEDTTPVKACTAWEYDESRIQVRAIITNEVYLVPPKITAKYIYVFYRYHKVSDYFWTK